MNTVMIPTTKLNVLTTFLIKLLTVFVPLLDTPSLVQPSFELMISRLLQAAELEAEADTKGLLVTVVIPTIVRMKTINPKIVRRIILLPNLRFLKQF